MGVTAAERRNQDERVRNIREEADQSERDIVKRKNAELKRAEQRHQEEVRRINDDYQNRLSSTKELYNNSLNEKDQRHLKQIEDVKETYRSQLKKKMEDSADEKTAMRNAFTAEIKNNKDISENQRKHLMDKQSEELEERDKKLAEIHDNTRQELKDTVSNHSDKLNAAHEKELNLMQKDKLNQLASKEKDKAEIRKYYEGELNRLTQQKDREYSRWEQKYYDTVTDMKDQQEDDLAIKAKILDDEIKLIKSRYQERLNEISRRIAGTNEELRATIEDRANGQLQAKESKIKDLEAKLASAIANDSRLRSLERKNLESAFQSQINILENQKNDQRTVLRELNDKHIDKLNEKNNAILREVDRKHKNDSSLKAEMYRQSLDNEKENNRTNLDRVTSQSEVQNKRIVNVSREREIQLNNFYKQSLDQAKDNFVDRVVDQRQKNDEDFARFNSTMNDKVRSIENRFSEKMENTINQYEQKLNALAEKNASDVKSLQDSYQTRLANQEKSHKTEKSSLEIKYEGKLASQRELQDQQLEKLNQRHQEELKMLATKMNNYNKKA